MNTKNILHTVFLVFLFTSFLINGCMGDDSSQSEPIRRIDLEGQKNFRDLGGYNNIYGESVRWRILFRSGDLYDLTDADLLIVNNLDLQLVIDFRSKEEIDERPDRSPAGTETLNDPITIEGFEELFNYFFDYVLETGDTSQLTVSNIANLYESIYTDNIEQFKVMFLDLLLPGMDGLGLCREIRKDEPDALIFAITGHASKSELMDCFNAGFDGYFLKPIDLHTNLICG